jgi:hypothetical protein
LGKPCEVKPLLLPERAPLVVTQPDGFVCAETSILSLLQIIEQSVFGCFVIKLEVQEKSAFNFALIKNLPSLISMLLPRRPMISARRLPVAT